MLGRAMFIFIYIAVLHISSCAALRIKPLPSIDMSALSLEDFDATYNNELPLIIRGSTTCPNNLDFTNIHQYCKGNVPLSFVHTKSESNDTWAGLMAGENKHSIDFTAFVRSMGSSDSLRFMFDLPMSEVCPSLPRHVTIPHFVNVFTSQFLFRHISTSGDVDNSTEWKKYCPRLPFFNMYLAEAGFQTNLHIDALHSAFSKNGAFFFCFFTSS